MKYRLTVLLFTALLQAGCNLNDVVEYGDKCPESEDEESESADYGLSYIGDLSCKAENGDHCELDSKTYDFSTFFQYNNCPLQYPKCYTTTLNKETYYYCDKDYRTETRESCNQNELACAIEGKELKFCVNPSLKKTCGASCDDDNYSGQNCSIFNTKSICDLRNDRYVCVSSSSGNLICDNDLEISPDADETCGANHCKAFNYGGDDCTQYDPPKKCQRIKKSYYECVEKEEEEKKEAPDIIDPPPPPPQPVEIECAPNECKTGSGEDAKCSNDDERCGAECQNCKELQAHCNEGICAYDACGTDQYPVFDEQNNIIECSPITLQTCASPARTPEDAVINCEAIQPEHAINISCSPAGKCVIEKCAAGFHLSRDNSLCVENTRSSCAPPDSNNPEDCSEILNIADPSSAGCSREGKCIVSKCAAGYHIAPDLSGCTANSKTSCAKPDSSSAVDCTQNAYEKVCNSAGECKCSADGSTVLNYDKNACVDKVCTGIPGVKKGKALTKSWYNSNNKDYACNALECSSGYKRTKQSNVNAWTCRPKEKTYKCIEKMGYKYKDGDGYCKAMNPSTGKNGHAHCKKGYRHYILACLPQNVCCGTRHDNMNYSKDYLCTNCTAKGKTCNISKGSCE